jgi:uncharacterized membrane protein
MQSTLRALFYFILLAAIGSGIYFRLTDLGKWSLAVDEYYFTQSVLNLLDHGVPVFDCGGYYPRGLLQQYITAVILQFSGDIEWGVRILPVIINLLAIPAVYILGKRLGGYVLACTVTALFCLSLWEIEYARFARMYAPFQTLFLWQLVLLVKVIEDNSRAALYGMYLVALAGLFVYEAAIFLTVLCAIPLLMNTPFQTVRHTLLTAGLVILNALYLAVDFRHLDAGPYLPDDVVVEASRQGSRIPVGLPDVILLDTLIQHVYWFCAGMVLCLVSVYSVWQLIRLYRPGFVAALAWVFLLLCSFLNLYGLLSGVFAFCLLTGLIRFTDLKNRGRFQAAAGMLIVNGVFWLLYGWQTNDWTAGFAGEDFDKYYKLLVVLLKYPDIYTSFIYQWLSAMPWLTVLIFPIIGLGIVVFILAPQQQPVFSVLAATLIIIVMLVGVMEVNYYTPRYTFFIYPLILLLFCASLLKISKLIFKNSSGKIITYSTFLIIFVFVSEDFEFAHLKNIASAEINFRASYNAKLAEVYYDRNDHATPARYINEHSAAGDMVISTLSVVPFYLNHLDYRFIDHRTIEFQAQSACGGTKAIWSNTDLIYRESDLFKIIDSSRTPVWVVMSAGEFFDLNRHFEKTYGVEAVYHNLDDTIVVYRVNK